MECDAETEVSVYFTDDAGIAALNEQYRRRIGPTDVLSFAMSEGPSAELHPQVLGDIVISVETAQRQARQRRITFDRELDTLLIHGLLHLLGYDHEGSPAEASKMRAKERELRRLLAAGD